MRGIRTPEMVQGESTSSALKWQGTCWYNYGLPLCGCVYNVFKVTPKINFYTMVTLNYFFFTAECREAVFFVLLTEFLFKSEDIDQVQETVSKFQ